MKNGSACRFAFGFASLFAACLVGCGMYEDQTITEFNSADWISRDQEVLYIYHTFLGHNDGIVRPTSVYSASGIKVYRRAIGKDGFGPAVLVYQADSLLPCGELVYRPSDSTVFLSYKIMDRHNVSDRHYCGESGSWDKKSLKFRLTDHPVESLPLETADSAMAAELEGSREGWTAKGIEIDSIYESLCVQGRCIYD